MKGGLRMKTRNLLLGMACMAAFTACSNNEEPVVPAEQTRTVTINVGIGADTRSALTVDGNGLKRTWDSADILTVAFKDAKGTSTYEQFELKSGAGTTSAVFEKSDSKLPATGTTKVLLWVGEGSSYYPCFDCSAQNGTIKSNGFDWLTTETTVTDGEFPASVSLESKSIFLKIPAGTKLINNVTGEQNYKMSVLNDNIVVRYDLRVNTDGFAYESQSSDGHVNITYAALNNGVLVNDCYIAFMTKGDITSLTIKLDKDGTGSSPATDNEITVREFKTPLEFGHIYNIQQSDLTLK